MEQPQSFRSGDIIVMTEQCQSSFSIEIEKIDPYSDVSKYKYSCVKITCPLCESYAREPIIYFNCEREFMFETANLQHHLRTKHPEILSVIKCDVNYKNNVCEVILKKKVVL